MSATSQKGTCSLFQLVEVNDRQVYCEVACKVLFLQAWAEWDKTGPFAGLQPAVEPCHPATDPPLRGILQLCSNPSCLLVLRCYPCYLSHPSLLGSEPPSPRSALLTFLSTACAGVPLPGWSSAPAPKPPSAPRAACLLLSSLSIHQSPPSGIAHIPQPHFIQEDVLLWSLLLLGEGVSS